LPILEKVLNNIYQKQKSVETSLPCHKLIGECKINGFEHQASFKLEMAVIRGSFDLKNRCPTLSTWHQLCSKDKKGPGINPFTFEGNMNNAALKFGHIPLIFLATLEK
jgi:hypothetical protein